MEYDFHKKHKDEEPPLVAVQVTNPLTYLKIWWKKVIGNEGVSFSFKIKPLTAIAIAVVVASIAFGVGRFVVPFTIPFFESTKILPTPTPQPWKDTAFIGTLQYSSITARYYLIVTSSSEAINLEVPENIDLKSMVSKRIFATGSYNKSIRLLKVADAKDMEILPKSPEPVPTTSPTPTPILTPTPTIEPTPIPIESPQ